MVNILRSGVMVVLVLVCWAERSGGVGGGGSVGCFGGGVGSGWRCCDYSGVVCDCFFWVHVVWCMRLCVCGVGSIQYCQGLNT